MVAAGSFVAPKSIISMSPNYPVTFDLNEPFCMLVPQRREDRETILPEIRDINTDPDMRIRDERWSQERTRFLVDLRSSGTKAASQGWQNHYFQGVSPGGFVAPEHQTRLNLRDFDMAGNGDG